MGVGNLGEEAVERFANRSHHLPEIHRLCVASCNDVASVESALAGLRTAEHFERIAELGFEIPETLLGHRARVSCFVVADVTDDHAPAALSELVSALESDQAADIALVLTTGEAGTEVLLPAVRKSILSETPAAILPMRRPAGDRSRDDITGAASLTLVCLTAPAFRGEAGPMGGLLRSTHTLGAAFADAASDEFLSAIRDLTASRFIRMQFENVRPFDPTPSYDEGGVTELESNCDWLRLAERLAGETPYIITKKGRNLAVALPRAEFALDLHDVPRDAWPETIRTMQQLMRYATGREWREKLEANASAISAELTEMARSDCERLHGSKRSTDRVLAWRETLLKLLKARPDVITRKAEGFDRAVAELAQSIEEAPAHAPLWVQCSLAALLCGGAGFALGSAFRGVLVGIIAAIVAAGAVLTVGALYLNSKEENVRRARDRALDALVGTFEKVAAANLATLLDRLKTDIEAAMTTEAEASERLAGEFMAFAEELEDGAGAGSDAVDVKPVVEPADVPSYLDGQSLPWLDFLSQACKDSVLAPVRSSDGQLELTRDRVTEYASRLVADGAIDVSFPTQLASGTTDAKERVEELLDDLTRRSEVGDPSAMTTVVHAADLDEALLAGKAAEEQAATASADLGLLGCLRMGRLPGEEGAE